MKPHLKMLDGFEAYWRGAGRRTAETRELLEGDQPDEQ